MTSLHNILYNLVEYTFSSFDETSDFYMSHTEISRITSEINEDTCALANISCINKKSRDYLSRILQINNFLFHVEAGSIVVAVDFNSWKFD